MNIIAFKDTLINILCYDAKFKTDKNILMPIISRSSINAVPRYEFAYRSDQHWEDIEIRVPVPLIDNANQVEEQIVNLVSYVYTETDEYALKNVLIRPKIICSPEEFTAYDVVFSEIQNTIIQGIRDAKYYYMGSCCMVY